MEPEADAVPDDVTDQPEDGSARGRACGQERHQKDIGAVIVVYLSLFGAGDHTGR